MSRRRAVPILTALAATALTLASAIRFFAVDAFSITKARPRSVAVLDSTGHEIGRSKIGH